MRRYISASLLAALFAATIAASAAPADVTVLESEPIAEPDGDRMLIATDSPGSLKVVGFSERTFVPRRGQMTCEVTGAEISQDVTGVLVRVNDVPLPNDSIRIARGGISIDYEFDDGMNEVVVTALDTEDRLLRADRLIWAGDNELTVDVIDQTYKPIDGAEVTVKLGEDEFVSVTRKSVTGTARFTNVPANRVHVTATLEALRAKETVKGDAGSLILQLGGHEQ